MRRTGFHFTLRLFAWTAFLTCLACTPTHAATTGDKQAATEKKLAQVKQDIAHLAQEERATKGRHGSIQAKLAQQSDKLAAASAALRKSHAAIKDNQQKLDALEQQRDALKAHLATQRHALAALLRAIYQVPPHSDLQLLLGGTDITRMARTLAYSRYFQGDRARRIHDLLGELTRLQQLRQAITARRDQLEAARMDNQQRVQQLDAARDEQKRLLAKVEATMQNQQQRMQQLKRDRDALSDLLEKLRTVIADIPENLPANTAFSKLRGKLPWPVAGKHRPADQGLHIAAPRGTVVHAVAHGRVVYANWLRGYGLLVVIDHGNGWMSLYGGNESVLRQPGDWVNAGDPVATAGASVGSDAGIYFGIRHDGKPVKAIQWLHK